MGATQKQPASEAMEKFFPPRYMDGSDGSDYDQSVLESYLIEKWASLRSKSVHDCVRIYLNCTRKWQFFGAQLFSVQVSTSTAILLSYCKTSIAKDIYFYFCCMTVRWQDCKPTFFQVAEQLFCHPENHF